MLYKMASKT